MRKDDIGGSEDKSNRSDAGYTRPCWEQAIERGTTRTMERYQGGIYLAAAMLGLLSGHLVPSWAGLLDTAIWPVLGLLLYCVFTQLPRGRLRQALGDGRFLVAALVGNFVLIPPLVFGLLFLLPEDPAIRLGVLLVLLVPCTDWFLSFTHMGGGAVDRATAFAPVSLLVQMLLLPVFLWAFLGGETLVSLAHAEMLTAFVAVILTPLILARVSAWGAARWGFLQRPVRGLSAMPVPLLALVIFMVAASQSTLVTASLPLLGHLAVIFVIYLVMAVVLARCLSSLFELPVGQGRTLAFSFGSRNSFVVLPIALSLSSGHELAVVVIVFQSLVELFGMLAYLRWLPTRIFPEPG